MEKPRFPVAVVMQKRTTRNRWQSEVWEPWGVLPGLSEGAAPRLLVDEAGVQQWLHPGFALLLHRDEAEGYYLNVSAQQPRVFVLWRMEGDLGLPLDVTASYNEGGRWLDGGHSVDSVPMPPEIFAWVGEYVEQNYRPEPKKRIKPRSFMHPKDRAAR
ncbi:MAG: DUF3305 domain-containing protein [Burkholderiales bacterium]